MVGSLPFFLRWFVHLDHINGSKQTGVEDLEAVASRGRYYGPLARMMLAIIHIREKRPAKAEGGTAGRPDSPIPGESAIPRELQRAHRLAHARSRQRFSANAVSVWGGLP